MRPLLAAISAVLAAAAMLAASCSSEEPAASPTADAAAGHMVGPGDAARLDEDASADVYEASAPVTDAAVDACAPCASGRCTNGACDPLVFVTSKDYAGAIGDGGVLSADDECQALASAAGLSGTYEAWLSAPGAPPPASRFTQKSARPYRLRDGRIVAQSFAALTSTLETAISVTEKGDDIGFAYVWTATRPDGTANADATGCAGWSSSDPSETGGTGESDDIVDEWTIFANLACSTRAHLYCFEQRP